MHINRLKTRRESWFFLIKIAYMLIGLPFLLIIGTVMFFSVTSERLNHRVPGDVAGTILIWAAILIPVGVFVYRVFSRNRLLKKIVLGMRSPEYFSPNENHELYHPGDCKYLGIDIRNGTILYVHKIRSGQMDVIGFSMTDWTAKEVQGNIFRLYTRIPELPMIQIGTPWAKNWYDTLDAMANKNYSTPVPFSQYVSEQIDSLKRKYRVYIHTLA